MSHPDLDASAQARLREILGTPQPVGSDGEGTATAPESGPRRRATLRRRVRERIRPMADPPLDRLAVLVADRLRQASRSEQDRLTATVELMRAEHSAVRHALDRLDPTAAAAAAQRLAAVEINAELMKGELAAFRSTLDQLGQAIAPAAGLPGVPARFAELRERVNALDRRGRTAAPPITAAADPTATPTGGGTEIPVVDPSRAAFDYVGFERRFRGDSATILTTLADRYAPLLRDHQPVLDFGCGRGELVEVLASRGIEASGVDPDLGMVEEAIGHGRAVHLGDGLTYLRSVEPQSLGAVITVHVVEHLPLPVLTELFDLAATRLRPGGIFVAETPNPMSLIVLGNSYILDPTHVWPLHPSLMTFLAERAGFREVEQRFYSPAEDYHLPMITGGPEAPPWIAEINVALDRLNHVLFGPQEYALIARTAPV